MNEDIAYLLWAIIARLGVIEAKDDRFTRAAWQMLFLLAVIVYIFSRIMDGALVT